MHNHFEKILFNSCNWETDITTAITPFTPTNQHTKTSKYAKQQHKQNTQKYTSQRGQKFDFLKKVFLSSLTPTSTPTPSEQTRGRGRGRGKRACPSFLGVGLCSLFLSLARGQRRRGRQGNKCLAVEVVIEFLQECQRFAHQSIKIRVRQHNFIVSKIFHFGEVLVGNHHKKVRSLDITFLMLCPNILERHLRDRFPRNSQWRVSCFLFVVFCSVFCSVFALCFALCFVIPCCLWVYLLVCCVFNWL